MDYFLFISMYIIKEIPYGISEFYLVSIETRIDYFFP